MAAAMAVLLGSAATAATGAAGRTSGHADAGIRLGDALAATPLPHLRAGDLRSGGRWRAAERAVLRARAQRGALGTRELMTPVGWFNGDDAAAIGDVTGDRRDDVLEVRSGSSFRVGVLSGADGKPVWHSRIHDVIGSAYLRMPTGPGEVIVLTGSVSDPGASPVSDAGTATFTVAARNARTGKQLWALSIDGVVEFDPVGGVVASIGEVDGAVARAGAAPLLVLDKFSQQFGLVENASSIQPMSVDAASGAVVATAPPVVTDSFGYTTAVGDLNGDGGGDAVVATFGDAAMAQADDLETGEPIWTVAPADALGVSFVEATPDVDGDRQADVLLGILGNAGDVVEAVDGSGNAVWSRPGDFADPVGDVDGDHRSDSRVVGFRDGGIQYSLVTGTGHTRWTRTVGVPSGMFVLSFGAGDVDGDGIGDTYVRVATKGTLEGTKRAVAAAVIDGRTGQVRKVPDLGWPLGASLDGRGVDFVLSLRSMHAITETAYDGRTGRPLWHDALRLAGARLWDQTTGRVDRHGRTGLVEIATGTDRAVIRAVGGRSGKTLWSTGYKTQGSGVVIIGGAAVEPPYGIEP